MSLSRKLVRLLDSKRSAGIPPDVANKTRLHIADAVGISLAARRAMAMGDWVSRALAVGGGSGVCSVIGGAQSSPPASEAFVNSALVHMLDYDDMHDAARLHPTPGTFPAALAASELAGAGGDLLVEGVAIGNELMWRLGLMWTPTGSGPGSDWFCSQLFGYVGSSIAAGVVLGLTEDEMVSALGLAYMQAAGGKEPGFGVDSNARSIYPAFAAMGGIHAVLLARAGIVGPPSALDGTAGLFRIYMGAEPGPAAMATLLDEDAWFFRDTLIKPWPSCRLSHSYIAAAFAVREKMPRAPVQRVVVAVNPSAAKLCRPLEARRRPRTIQDGKHSIPFMTAFALARGKVDLETLTEKALDDPAVLELAARMEIAETLPDNPGNPPAEIAVYAAGACIRSPKHDDAALKPSPAQIREKFTSCLAYARRATEAGGLWERLVNLDATRVSEVLRAIPRVAIGEAQVE
ncbi:MAG: MmgE/PrpD family protein [Betaproteobacteria bacterium]|nr:MmgE/PrpD family protein [Betaproteobacteria bacterium]